MSAKQLRAFCQESRRAGILTRGWFAPPVVLASVWKHFWLSQLWRGGSSQHQRHKNHHEGMGREGSNVSYNAGEPQMYRLGLKQGGQTRTQVPGLDLACVSWGCFLHLCSSVTFVERTDNRAVVCWGGGWGGEGCQDGSDCECTCSQA